MASVHLAKSLICFVAVLLFIHKQTVSGSGSFQIYLNSLRNIKHEKSNGECCDGSRTIHHGQSVCRDECDTFFRVCLNKRNTQHDLSTGPCMYGEVTTVVLRRSSISFTNTSSSNNGFRNPISIHLSSLWRVAYSLVLEARDADNSSNSELIDRVVQRGTLLSNNEWELHAYNSSVVTISYKIRVICDADYYGNRCKKFCRARNDNSGHYTCDKNGNKVCLSGWRGDRCDTGDPPTFSDPDTLKRAFKAWPASHSVKLKCKAMGAAPLNYTWLKDGKILRRRRWDPYLNTSIWYLKLKDLRPGDAGEYTCIVSNPYGSINHTYTVRVLAKPRTRPILRKDFPRNKSAQAGESVTMKCLVVVSGTLPDFRWLKWDKSITFVSNIRDNLEDGPFQLIDLKYYSAIQQGPESYGSELKISNVTEEDFGLYTCYVSNHIGAEYNSAFLSRALPSDRGDPPTFSDPDTLKRAFKAWPASHSVKLKCKAMGAAPLNYTWLKDGKILRRRRWDPYLNTSIWYLKLKDLRPGDAGEYTCIVSNPYGSINHTYTVRVLAKPRTRPILRKDFPRNKSAQAGESVTMKCLVVLSGTLPDFRWLKWDKSITFVSNMGDNLEDGPFQLIDLKYYSAIQQGPESYGSELKISNVTEEDFGLYTCYVSNHIGAEYNSAFLSRALPSDRGDPPTFSDPDTLKRAFKAWPASHSVKLKCKAMGAAPLNYTWLKDGKILRRRRWDPYLNTSIWYLKLKDLRPGDAGEYTCIVSNPYGSINHTYTVRVLAKPRTRPILRKDFPRNKSAQAGESVTMKCLVVVSGTLPDFRWLKWDKSITFVSNIRDNLEDGPFQLIDLKYYSAIQQGPESYGSELKISNVTEEDFGLYTCYVSNHIGAEYNSAFLSRALPSDRENPLEPKGTGSESDDPVIMGQVSWILLGVSITVFIAMVTASAWLCMKMRKLKNRSRANARGSRHDIGSLRPRYDVQNEYVVVPDFN
ncbi:hemicentin-2-like isoform X2 [Porites lutea]|uniref:hemicentin-2-like isoform X2 n=1 Tax=Porites lutea TaxID=51062 RepID=UPI003CC68F24